jgi:NAD(P)-dependent dehydrogenase (short-subunit alcohol dehydrogenase family)
MSDEMKGKVVLITGATNGIGKVTALELAKMGAMVVIVGRSAAKTAAVVRELRAQSGSFSVDSLVADLFSQAEVRSLAGRFRQSYTRLDVLVNNAGAVFSQRQETVDGYEMTFAFNHLAYFLLTNLLLDLLKASAPSRIVNVSSGAHTLGPLDFDDLMSKNYGLQGFKAYGQSKLANVQFTYELARRLEGSGVTVNALHPGGVNTGFGKNNAGVMKLAMKVFGLFSLSPEQGAQTSIYLASSPEVAGVTGKYFDRCKPVASSKYSYDESAQRRLWEISEKLTGLS